jgi:hypothetical protein
VRQQIVEWSLVAGICFAASASWAVLIWLALVIGVL